MAFLNAILYRSHTHLIPVLGTGLDAMRSIDMDDRDSFKAGQCLYFSVFCSRAAAGANSRMKPGDVGYWDAPS